MRKKLTIKNRKGQNVVVLLDIVDNQKGLAFVMHGNGVNKEQTQLVLATGVFLEKNISVVRFDATNAMGESDGSVEDATVTNFLEDLEDVISWVETQDFFQEPFFMLGHSIGALSVATFAERNPQKVKALVLFSSIISGKISFETRPKDFFDEWKRTGWRILESNNGNVKRLKWSHMVDRLRYDLLPSASSLSMPILQIAGELDPSAPPKFQKLLFDVITHENKEFHVIKGASHDFLSDQELSEVKSLLSKWIKKTL